MPAKGRGFATGFIEFFTGIVAIVKSPLRNAAWLVALAIGDIVILVWGSVFTFIGWLECRKRLASDGLIGVGEVLAPKLGREQYKDGVWTGFWRVHTLSFAFVLVQLPTLLFAFSPAIVAHMLFKPFNEPELELGMAGVGIGLGIPGLIALGCGVLAAAESFLALRLLAIAGPKHSVGLVVKVTGAAWRATLSDFTRLMGLAAALVASAFVVVLLLGGAGWLAGKLEMTNTATRISLTWIGLPAGAIFAASVFGALAAWSADAKAPSIEGGPHFCFSAWLYDWLAAVFAWFARAGVLWVGVGVCLVAGTAAAFVALRTQAWVPLGVFAAAAAVLVVLRWRGK